METFKIEIKETYAKIVEIQADSPEHAFDKIQQLYSDKDIVLDSENYVETEFSILEE